LDSGRLVATLDLGGPGMETWEGTVGVRYGKTFHVLYDEQTKLYRLLSTQATDSMIRPDRMPADRDNLPNNERRRLQLHFSKNMIDWCFAGLVAVGPAEHASRHYASMAIEGKDLVILSRSGDQRAKSANDGNLINDATTGIGLIYLSPAPFSGSAPSQRRNTP
jgi:hypothetical protein